MRKIIPSNQRDCSCKRYDGKVKKGHNTGKTWSREGPGDQKENNQAKEEESPNGSPKTEAEANQKHSAKPQNP
jgi:hypothetical protein